MEEHEHLLRLVYRHDSFAHCACRLIIELAVGVARVVITILVHTHQRHTSAGIAGVINMAECTSVVQTHDTTHRVRSVQEDTYVVTVGQTTMLSQLTYQTAGDISRGHDLRHTPALADCTVAHAGNRTDLTTTLGFCHDLTAADT